MPLEEANLTDKEAMDIATYVNSKERPHFELRKHLPPSSQLGEYNGKID